MQQKIGRWSFVILLAILFSPVQAQTRREVAVTFDDLPSSHGDFIKMKEVTDGLMAKLALEKIPAIGFVNEGKLFVYGEIDKRTELLKRWVDSGYELGNHTFSHISIDQVPFEQYAEDLMRGETVTRLLLRERGLTLRYYRHPQLRTGPTVEYQKRLSEFLARRNYTVAPVTIDNNDYIFAVLYARAKASKNRDLQDKIVAAYLEYMNAVFEHFEKLSKEFLGYEVKQTLLLHANELNGDHFDKLAEMIRKRGYSFIKLEEALKDPAYQLPEAQTTRGLSWLHRWMLAKGRPMNEEPAQPEWIDKLFRSRPN